MDTKEDLKKAIISHYEVYMSGYEAGRESVKYEEQPCPDCDGTGGNNANCKRCKGTGVIELANDFFKK